MEISPLSLVTMTPVVTQNKEKEVQENNSFGRMLSKALNEINQTQLKADQLEIKFLTGEVQDLHQVIIAMEEARLMMSLAVEVRNRIVESYQEISRMQI